MREVRCDVLIVGGGTGGCAAALALADLGWNVLLTEETDWVGGQLTAQAVPPDEHPWIESKGCTRRYRDYRLGVRALYRTARSLTPAALGNPTLNPGGGWVSKLCHEPAIGHEVLAEQFAQRGNLQVLLHTKASSAQAVGDLVSAVELENLSTGERTTVSASYFIDATELGDLLPMTGTEYVVGAESKEQTQEPNAVDGPPQPSNVQGLTWVFAMAHDAGSHRVIDRPEQYERWRAFRPEFWPGPFLGFDDINPVTGQPRHLPIFGGEPVAWYPGDFGLFTYRQIVDPAIFADGSQPHPVTIVNWPQNDYFVESIIDRPQQEVNRCLADAKQLSLSLLYWLQTEAPRPDGGAGYPGLYLRPDITGTQDGFAKSAYIREARRIEARFTVLEQHVAQYTNPGCTVAPPFSDSVGVGSYRLDLHPSTNGVSYIDTATLPFEIPLGSLIPKRMRNLLPACKNLGTTHMTNGCYRLHPIEWNIGESAGLLIAFCLANSLEPHQVADSQDLTGEFQSQLKDQGVEIHWDF